MTDYSLDRGQLEALHAAAEAPGGRGDEFVVSCNADADDRAAVRRVGPKGGRLDSRVVIATRSSKGDMTTVFLAAPEARQYAARILNAADEADGVTPLALLPRFPDEPENAPSEASANPTAPGSLLAWARARAAERFSR